MVPTSSKAGGARTARAHGDAPSRSAAAARPSWPCKDYYYDDYYDYYDYYDNVFRSRKQTNTPPVLIIGG